MRTLASALLLLPLVASLPPHAGAEIYRWVDDEGREHFTSDLHQVPPRHRRDAAEEKERRSAADDDPANLNRVPDAAEGTPRVRRRIRRRPSPPPAAPEGSYACSSWRQQARALQSRIENYRKQMEIQEERHRRLVRTDRRLHAEDRAEDWRIHLEAAEREYEALRQRARSKGVDPGCLR